MELLKRLLDTEMSRSFIVKFNNKSYAFPLIKVVRSILAPNRFFISLI
ncbi:hypothetical protein JPSP12_17650 [Staphylococcus pseudintermedius]